MKATELCCICNCICICAGFEVKKIWSTLNSSLPQFQLFCLLHRNKLGSHELFILSSLKSESLQDSLSQARLGKLIITDLQAFRDQNEPNQHFLPSLKPQQRICVLLDIKILSM